MQMLASGGMPVLADALRPPDEDNPRGYFELDDVKRSGQRTDWLNQAAGKAVKVIHLLLPRLPVSQALRYQVILVRRDVREVLASQAKMLQRQGRAGAALPPEQLAGLYEQQLAACTRWMAEHPERFRVLEVRYADLISRPAASAAEVNLFLGGKLDEKAMEAAVDPALYRNRA